MAKLLPYIKKWYDYLQDGNADNPGFISFESSFPTDRKFKTRAEFTVQEGEYFIEVLVTECCPQSYPLTGLTVQDIGTNLAEGDIVTTTILSEMSLLHTRIGRVVAVCTNNSIRLNFNLFAEEGDGSIEVTLWPETVPGNRNAWINRVNNDVYSLNK